MYDIPGFDPASMSEDELLNKQADIAMRISYLSRYSGAPEAIGQLQMMSEAINAIRRERAYMEGWAIRQSMFPEVIETEPDMRTDRSQRAPSGGAAGSKPNRPRPFAGVRRTTSGTAPAEPPPTPTAAPTRQPGKGEDQT